MKASRAWLILIFMVFAVSPGYAQWEYGGKAIGAYSSGSSALAVANVNDGATVVVWNRRVGGDYDIYAQYVDSSGYTWWGQFGMAVYEDDGIRQRYPAVLPDGEGGVFIVWSDERHVPDEGIALYGQRLNRLGNYLWDPEGVRLTADSINHKYPQLYADGQGGFVAVFETPGSGEDVGAQRSDGNGNTLWDSTGIFLTRVADDQLFPKTCKASETTFITCWRDWRDRSDLGSDIYMQSFDLDGNILWDPDGIPAVHWPNNQGYYYGGGHDIVCDGYGGAVVVWVDQRTLYNMVLFADRFSSSGQSLWQENGLQLGSNLLYEALECQAFKLGDNFMFRWGGPGNGFRVSYLNAAGGFIWDEPVVLDGSHVYRMFMEPAGVFYFLTAYTGEPFPYGAGAKVDTTGYRFWPDYPMIGADIRSESHRVLTDGYGGMIAVWKASGSLDIKIAKIYADGHVGGDNTAAGDGEDSYRPDRMSLYQNYPNPFNGATTIHYEIEQISDVRIEIYDILGQIVYNDDLGIQNAGKHIYNLNMNAYPSGIYFLNVYTANKRSESIKLVLLK